MTLVREYQPTFVLGDGETKEFSYLFEEVSENFIKVIVKHSDDSTYVPVFSVDLDSHKVVFGESETAPLDTDIICIYRETPDLQDTPFRTLQGYDAKALENILSKIVAMIQELKANGFSTQILQGTPWQLDLLHPADDGASVVIDYNARILKKGLYFQIVSGNLQVSADGNSFIAMPKSADITEFRRLETVLEDLTVQYRLQYKVDGVWYNAESNAEATADEALQIAQDAKDIAQDASDKVDTFDDRLTIAEGDASAARQDASDARDIAQAASDKVDAFDDRLTIAEGDASDAKSIAQTTSGNLTTHTSNTNNPHQVTKAQVGLDNVDNTSDLNKPISTATQTALDTKANITDIPTVGNGTITFTQGGITKGTITTNQSGNTTIEFDAGGGSIDAIDGVTITKNSDDEIQAVATVNQNTATGATNPIYDWVGTLAEYQAQNIETLHPDWICYITDDVSGAGSVFDTLYPVGSIYMGVLATCPLTTIIPGSVWTLVASKIVIHVPNNVPVVGNGMTLGLTDGTNFAGLQKGTDTWQGQTFGYTVYGTNVGTTGASWDHANTKSWGVTTDSTKSGLIADMTSVNTITTNVWIRTA